jgi:hypothetical protein
VKADASLSDPHVRTRLTSAPSIEMATRGDGRDAGTGRRYPAELSRRPRSGEWPGIRAGHLGGCVLERTERRTPLLTSSGWSSFCPEPLQPRPECPRAGSSVVQERDKAPLPKTIAGAQLARGRRENSRRHPGTRGVGASAATARRTSVSLVNDRIGSERATAANSDVVVAAVAVHIVTTIAVAASPRRRSHHGQQRRGRRRLARWVAAQGDRHGQHGVERKLHRCRGPKE